MCQAYSIECETDRGNYLGGERFCELGGQCLCSISSKQKELFLEKIWDKIENAELGERIIITVEIA